ARHGVRARLDAGVAHAGAQAAQEGAPRALARAHVEHRGDAPLEHVLGRRHGERVAARDVVAQDHRLPRVAVPALEVFAVVDLARRVAQRGAWADLRRAAYFCRSLVTLGVIVAWQYGCAVLLR